MDIVSKPVNDTHNVYMKQLSLAAISKFIRWHRTSVAVLALFVALVAGLTALAPARDGTPLVVAARALQPGSVLTEADFVLVSAPADLLPDGCFSSIAGLVGRSLSVGITRGTPVTTAALTADALTDRQAGEMLVPFRVRDPDVAGLLRVGDHLTIVSSTPEGTLVTIAEHVRVAQVPAGAGGGVWSSNSGQTGALIVVAAAGLTARDLAAASDQWLGVVIE